MASCWNELGIAQTADLGTIRRAYSALLKRIDADEDRDGFIRLREAYEMARADATERLQADWDHANTANPPMPLVEPDSIAPTPVEDAPPPTEAAISPAYDSRPFQRINVILFSERPARSTDVDELRVLTETILADPRMEFIEHARDVESWLVDIIVHSDERGDVMLGPVIERFGWKRDSRRWDEHPVFGHLVERHEGAQMIARLSQPDNHFHLAYLELTRSKGGITTRGGRDQAVLDLINMIRAEAPFAESRLNPERLNLWIEHLNWNRPSAPGSANWSYLWLAWPAVIILSSLERACNPS